MPISKDRMKLYPGGSIRSLEWLAIRGRILERAGNRCEGNAMFPECRAENSKPHPVTGSLVVLTIGHSDQDETNNDDSNLFAWCQKCHCSWDAKHRAVNASITRSRKLGQPDLYGRPMPPPKNC
jgi:hypothetical protein